MGFIRMNSPPQIKVTKISMVFLKHYFTYISELLICLKLTYLVSCNPSKNSNKRPNIIKKFPKKEKKNPKPYMGNQGLWFWVRCLISCVASKKSWIVSILTCERKCLTRLMVLKFSTTFLIFLPLTRFARFCPLNQLPLLKNLLFRFYKRILTANQNV